ncbi:type II secretion system protein [Yersinia mollaretii]|uniref:type II secretion system protein n=1 Tax=Yersinia mollaretii TaxID=33060 RepID=UPI0011A54415|nr:type II secretion system protein [Yersinia mollaretii]MDN0111355.1 type II secretion system protein [Yersinia mollaretii]
MNQKQRMERGITLIEMAIALMLVAVAVAGIVTWMSSINQQLQLRGDAKHFSSVAKAAQLYLKGERGTLVKEYEAGRMAKVVNISELQNKGYLATEIQEKLGKKQQDMTMLIRLSKPANNVEIRGLLITTGGISSSPNYTNDELGTMVNMAGTSAGFMASTGSPVQGISGSWKVDPALWDFGPEALTPGHLAALLTDTLINATGNSVKDPYIRDDYTLGHEYTNTSGKYELINIRVYCQKNGWDWDWGRIDFFVNSMRVATIGTRSGHGANGSASFIVPPGAKWKSTREKRGSKDMCYVSDIDSGGAEPGPGNRYVVTELPFN